VDEIGNGKRLGTLEHAVEITGLQRAETRQLEPEALEKLPQRSKLLLRRSVVHPVDNGRAFDLERLGGGDIGLDHELLDQPMGVETRGHDDALDATPRIEQDLAL